MSDRRLFLKQLALATGAIMASNDLLAEDKSDKWGRLLPQRRLGKSNQYVSMLGVGGFHVGSPNEYEAQEIIETAMEGGVRFFDNAEAYHKGESEKRYGKFLVPKYRDDVFIMTKSQARNKKTALEHLEGSLRRMNCDYIDLWQVHSLGSSADVDLRIKNEVLEVFETAKAQGKVKHIGFTGHQNPFTHLHMFDKTKEKNNFDTIQMPINVIDSYYHSFIKNALPVALERDFGVIAMKTLSDGRFFDKKERSGRVLWTSDDPLIPNYLSIKEALYFAWSLPISVLVTGAENKTYLQEKIDLAKSFTHYSESDRLDLMDRVFSKAGGKIEYYKKM